MDVCLGVGASFSFWCLVRRRCSCFDPFVRPNGWAHLSVTGGRSISHGWIGRHGPLLFNSLCPFIATLLGGRLRRPNATCSKTPYLLCLCLSLSVCLSSSICLCVSVRLCPSVNLDSRTRANGIVLIGGCVARSVGGAEGEGEKGGTREVTTVRQRNSLTESPLTPSLALSLLPSLFFFLSPSLHATLPRIGLALCYPSMALFFPPRGTGSYGQYSRPRTSINWL